MRYSFLQSEMTPSPEAVNHRHARRSVVGEAGNQRHPRARYPTNDSGQLDRLRQFRKDQNYNEDVYNIDIPLEPVSQPSSFALDLTLKAAATSNHWLAEARAQLRECTVCAEEDELPLPSQIALTTSLALLQQFSGNFTSQPDIYPMDEGGIAIDFRTPDGRSGVLFVIDQDGAGAMFYCTAGMRGRLRVDDASQLSREGAVATLKRVGIR